MPSPAAKRYNYHLHVGAFISGLEALGHTVATYGSDKHLTYSSVKWPNVTELVREIKPDCYISVNPYVDWHRVREVGRTFPHMAIVGCTPDFHYRPTLTHLDCCDLILLRAQKHIESTLVDSRVRWFPFSVDENVVPDFVPWEDRSKRVFFSGAEQAEVYPVRHRAITKLRNSKLLDTAGGYMGYASYLTRSSRCVASLSCQSIYGIQPAKLVEYAAAGSIPMFDEQTYGEKVVPHILEYTPENVVGVFRDALRDPAWESRVLANRAHVLKNHTHRVRAQQLVDWLTP
jgi:hypothetical protein